jgi:hypothetical protein
MGGGAPSKVADREDATIALTVQTFDSDWQDSTTVRNNPALLEIHLFILKEGSIHGCRHANGPPGPRLRRRLAS